MKARSGVALLGRAMPLDGAARADHPFLDAGDECVFIAPYIANRGYRAGGVNQLLANFKCKPSTAAYDIQRLRHKERAIGSIAACLREAVAREQVESSTWVPIPPSKSCGHPDYDNRLARTLRAAFRDYELDLRLLLRQVVSTAADHIHAERLSASALYDIIQFNAAARGDSAVRRHIVLFDDILTTGKHYKCCERRLREALPGVSISGLFVARRVLRRRGRGPAWDTVREPVPR